MPRNYDQETKEFVEDLKKFMLDADPGIPKEDLDQEFDTDNPDSYGNKVIVAAFRNSLFRIDDQIQQDVASELKTINEMIPKVADPEDINTKKIQQTIQQIIEEAEEDIDYITIESEADLEELEDEPLR